MASIDLHKLALRLKVIEMLQINLRLKKLEEASIYWGRLYQPN